MRTCKMPNIVASFFKGGKLSLFTWFLLHISFAIHIDDIWNRATMIFAASICRVKTSKLPEEVQWFGSMLDLGICLCFTGNKSIDH